MMMCFEETRSYFQWCVHRHSVTGMLDGQNVRDMRHLTTKRLTDALELVFTQRRETALLLLYERW